MKVKKLLTTFIFLIFLFSCNKKDDAIVYNLVSEPLTLNPYKYSEQVSVQLMNNIYEGLLRLTNDDKIELGLAKSYEKIDDKLIFEIREDAKWSDGTNITVDDFVKAFRVSLDKKTGSRYADLLYSIKNARAYNKGEVSEDMLGVANENNKLVITLEEQNPHFEYVLTLPISFAYSEGKYSGPYIIKNRDSSQISLEKNPHYWNKQLSCSDIKIIFVSDFSVVENLIDNNEVDITRVESYNLEEKVNTNQLYNYENGRVWYLDFNLNNELLKSKENRIAIRDAINRNEYVQFIKSDGSKVAKSVLSSVFKDYRKIYDDKNNFSDNKKSDILSGKKLRLLAGNSSTEVKEANYIQEILRKNLNLDVEVTTVSLKDRLALTRSGDYDMVLNTYSPKTSDELTVLKRWYNKKKDYYDIWSKQKYEDLFEMIQKEKNKEKRYELITEAQNILVDEAVIAPIYFSTENWYVKKGIKNVVVHPISNTMDLFKLVRE